ncbi:MAG: transporter associated domain-containing protein [Eubacteriales bacterium]
MSKKNRTDFLVMDKLLKLKGIRLLNKQYLRSAISKGASFTEIYISLLILVGNIILSVVVLHDLHNMIVSISQGNYYLSVENFLSTALDLIIGIEFVKMLSKHTPSSVIEVLLYAVARKLITDHSSMLYTLIGVFAILILFAIKKYLISSNDMSSSSAIIVNGALGVKELNDYYNINIDDRHGTTIAGVISNLARYNNQRIKSGLEVLYGMNKFEVYAMDENLIKKVRISRVTE